jgi:hypothetical protein
MKFDWTHKIGEDSGILLKSKLVLVYDKPIFERCVTITRREKSFGYSWYYVKGFYNDEPNKTFILSHHETNDKSKSKLKLSIHYNSDFTLDVFLDDIVKQHTPIKIPPPLLLQDDEVNVGMYCKDVNYLLSILDKSLYSKWSSWRYWPSCPSLNCC